MVTLASVNCIFKTFIGGAITFIGKKSSAIKRRPFKITKARVADNIKGVNRHNLK